MATDIYLGFNTHIDVANRVYPAYDSEADAFSDITGLASMSLEISYNSPLHWRSDNTIEFVATSSSQGMENYCCWDMGYIGARRKYGFGLIVSSQYTGQDANKKMFKYVARRDFMTEYISALSFSRSLIERYTVPKTLDTFGAFPQDEPTAIRQGIISSTPCYCFSGKNGNTRSDFFYVVTLVATPQQTASESRWENPEPIQFSQNVSDFGSQQYATAAECFVVIPLSSGGTYPITEANSAGGAGEILKACAACGVSPDQYIASISLVPQALVGASTSYTVFQGEPGKDIRPFRAYPCKVNANNFTFDLGISSKSTYYGKYVSILGKNGEQLISSPAQDCFVSSLGKGSVTCWATFHENPILKIKLRGSNDFTTYLDEPDDILGRTVSMEFPKFSISSDTFQQWWRGNKTQVAGSYINAALGIAQMVGGVATTVSTAGIGAALGAGMIASGAGTIASGVSGVIQSQNSITSAEASSVKVSSIIGADLDPYGALFKIAVYGPCESGNAEDDDRLSSFLWRYGYAVGNQVFIPKKDNGRYWTYIKGKVSLRASYQTDLPTAAGMNEILNEFENGVTLWHKSELSSFGNFNQANSSYRN